MRGRPLRPGPRMWDHSRMADLSSAGRPTPRSTLSLDPQLIVSTLSTLHGRISERFPSSGLAQLCKSLLETGEKTKERLDEVESPVLWLRSATWLMAGMVIVAVVAAVRAVLIEIPNVDSAFTAIQVLEAGIQDVVFIGIGLAFLVTAENRLRRNQALRFIRELRAVAHIVDMHQLTKDPHQLFHPGTETDSSPDRPLSTLELGRYLDYCSELLSLTAKIAALYAERFNDAVILQAVDEVEALTTGLSRKIWQKIMILNNAAPRAS